MREPTGRVELQQIDVPGYDIQVQASVADGEIVSLQWQMPADEYERFRLDTVTIEHAMGTHDRVAVYDLTPIKDAVESVGSVENARVSWREYRCEDCGLGGERNLRDLRCRDKKHPLLQQKEAEWEMLQAKADHLKRLKGLVG